MMNRFILLALLLSAQNVVVVQPTHISPPVAWTRMHINRLYGRLLGLSLKLHYFSGPAAVLRDYMAVDKHTAINHHTED